MKSMVVRSLAGYACVTLLAACGGDEVVAMRSTQTDAGVLGMNVGEGECVPGAQACYCPDGTQNGMQACVLGTLTECACPAAVLPTGGSAGGGAGGEPSGVKVERLCPELEGTGMCDANSFESKQLPASILFVLDRSGSMACNPPPVQSVEDCNLMPFAKDATAPSRWSITVDALEATFENMQASSAAVGLTTFSVNGACGVASMPNVGLDVMSDPQISALSAALHAFEPRGATPIVGATILSYAHLHQEAMSPGNRYVVLITDGEESCGFAGDESNTDDLRAARHHLLEVEVGNARLANIRTFVVGAPGSEGARGFLSELAFLGGTARTPDCVHGDADGTHGDCHYDLTTQDDFARVLGEALSAISGQALGCEFATPDGHSSMINVQYTVPGGAPQCLAHDEGPCNAGANGWQFAKLPHGTNDYSKVILCGQACEDVKSGAGSVDVILGCPILE